MNIKKLFTRNFEDDSEGTQVQDIIFCGKKFRIVVSFDEYYSSYGCEHWNDKKMCEVLEPNGDRILVKHLFVLPFKIKYICNNGDKVIYKLKPDVFKVIERPKKVEVDVKILEDICKYCENQSINDKLGSYGNFYYKIKKLLKNNY